MAASSDILVEHITGEFGEIALCSICTEVFTNPRLLTCRHTFCLNCLQRCAEDKRCGDSVACPICRQESVIPSGGMVNLERNRDMERLVETSRRVEMRLKEGQYYCEKHTGKPIVLYCQTCSSLVCSTCIVSTHAGHQFQETETAADELMKRLETKLGHSISESVTQLQSKLSQIDRVSNWRSVQKNRSSVYRHHKDVVALLIADRERILSELQVATEKMHELKEETNSYIEKLQSFGSLTQGKKMPLDVISQCSHLLELPIEDVLSKEIDEMSLYFEPSFKLFKLQSKAINLLGTVSCAASEKEGQKMQACYSENVSKSMFGASAMTDEDFDSGKVQPVCPDWCSCDYCEPTSEASERRCCASLRLVLQVCESAGVACVTQLPAFRVNCLNLSVIQLAYYEHQEKHTSTTPIHEIYRELSCIRFRRWIYRVPRGHTTNGVPACALEHIRQTFPAEDSCAFDYPR